MAWKGGFRSPEVYWVQMLVWLEGSLLGEDLGLGTAG